MPRFHEKVDSARYGGMVQAAGAVEKKDDVGGIAAGRELKRAGHRKLGFEVTLTDDAGSSR